MHRYTFCSTPIPGVLEKILVDPEFRLLATPHRSLESLRPRLTVTVCELYGVPKVSRPRPNIAKSGSKPSP